MSRRSQVLLVALMVSVVAAVSVAQNVKKVPAPYTSPASGKDMYVAHCAACHGADGKGDGPAATALKTPPTDLTMLTKSNGGKFPYAHVFNAIKGDATIPAHGSKDMPVWGNLFMELSHGHESEVHLRVTNLTDYVKSLQEK